MYGLCICICIPLSPALCFVLHFLWNGFKLLTCSSGWFGSFWLIRSLAALFSLSISTNLSLFRSLRWALSADWLAFAFGWCALACYIVCIYINKEPSCASHSLRSFRWNFCFLVLLLISVWRAEHGSGSGPACLLHNHTSEFCIADGFYGRLLQQVSTLIITFIMRAYERIGNQVTQR